MERDDGSKNSLIFGYKTKSKSRAFKIQLNTPKKFNLKYEAISLFSNPSWKKNALL